MSTCKISTLAFTFIIVNSLISTKSADLNLCFDSKHVDKLNALEQELIKIKVEYSYEESVVTDINGNQTTKKYICISNQDESSVLPIVDKIFSQK